MAIQTIKAGGRTYRVTLDTQNRPGFPFLEIGPGGTSSAVSMVMVQFNPSIGFDGSFNVMARCMGPAADAIDMPFVPVPYRRVTINDVAQDYAISIATVAPTAATLIQIPTNGLSVVLQMAPTTGGQCDITMWDVQGSSAI